MGQSWRRALRALVREGKVSIVFGDRHPNAHIKAFPSEPVAEQLSKLDSNAFEPQHVCAYPTEAHMVTVIGPTDYADRPFTRRWALGTPQLDFESFDLSVLEYYRNPRYS